MLKPIDDHSDPFESFLENDDESAVWMVTFADLMSLLLVFFVLLYSIASFNLQQFVAAFENLHISTKSTQDPQTGMIVYADYPALINSGKAIEEVTGLRKRSQKFYEELEQILEDETLTEFIDLQEVDGKIILTLEGNLLFDSGSADLKKTMAPFLENIAHLTEDYQEYTLNIRGHTDDVPISSIRFPSNWELSAIRATAVLRKMISLGVSPERLTATGFGDALPIVPNNNEKNRSINRRVEFVLEKKTN